MASPTHQMATLRPGEPGYFFDDYCNWTRIPEFGAVIRQSPVAEIAAQLMRSDRVPRGGNLSLVVRQISAPCRDRETTITADDARPKERRPKRFPPPEFPMRRPARFAKTPPAIFPAILGLMGLALAVRAGPSGLALPLSTAEVLAGLAVAVWGFAVFAYLAKLIR